MRMRLAAVIALLLGLAACVSDAERQHRVAEDPHATVDEIVAAGSPVDVVVNKGQILVTWEAEPDDDEGPYKGAWRLYTADDDGNSGDVIADGSFGTVREQSAKIEAWPVDDGFVLSDYRTDTLHRVDRAGRITSLKPRAKPAASLAGGVLVDFGDGEGPVILDRSGQVTPLPKLPAKNPQDLVLDAGGTLWVMFPWKENGPIRLAHAMNGRGPWIEESVPLRRGLQVTSYSMSTSGGRLFLPTTHGTMGEQGVDAIMVRPLGPTGRWRPMTGGGISRKLTAMPTFESLPKGGLLATTGGEGAWILSDGAKRWRAVKGVVTNDHSIAEVFFEGGRLWSAESWFGTSLDYSTDGGKSWTEFDRAG